MQTTRREFIKNSLVAGAVVALPVSAFQGAAQSVTVDPTNYLDNIAELYAMARKPACFPSFQEESDDDFRKRVLDKIRANNDAITEGFSVKRNG